MIEVSWNARIQVERAAVVIPKYSGWRVLHKVEGGNPATPAGMPEVTPPMYSVTLEMTQAIQWMSYNLMTAMNPVITKQLWTKVHRYDKAFTNKNGFERDGDPRWNYIENTNAGSPLPKYDKAQRLCGGQFLRGIEIGDSLQCVAGVHGIDASQPMPSVDTIIERNWYLLAVSTGLEDESKIDHFPQGKGGPVAIPFIFNGVINFPMEYFEPWEADALPDPLKIYSPGAP